MIDKKQQHIEFKDKVFNDFLSKKAFDASTQQHFDAIIQNMENISSLHPKDYPTLIKKIHSSTSSNFKELKRYSKLVSLSEYPEQLENSFKASQQLILRNEYSSRVSLKFDSDFKNNDPDLTLEVIANVKDNFEKIYGLKIDEYWEGSAKLDVIEKNLILNNPYKEVDKNQKNILKYGSAHTGKIELNKQVTSRLNFLGNHNINKEQLQTFVNSLSVKLYDLATGTKNTSAWKFKK